MPLILVLLMYVLKACIKSVFVYVCIYEQYFWADKGREGKF